MRDLLFGTPVNRNGGQDAKSKKNRTQGQPDENLPSTVIAA